jgi:hypothetical protein
VTDLHDSTVYPGDSMISCMINVNTDATIATYICQIHQIIPDVHGGDLRRMVRLPFPSANIPAYRSTRTDGGVANTRAETWTKLDFSRC